MAKQIIEDAVWKSRLVAANKYYTKWESLFKCDIIEKYYEGKQWNVDAEKYNPYTINKFYETVQIKLAEFIPTFPKFEISATPGNSDFNEEEAVLSAQMKGDVINTIITDPRSNFSSEIREAYKDHFFRFAIVETGYAADWIDNPNAQKPTLQKDVEQNPTNAKKIVSQPDQLPVNERIYFKHVNAKRFRVGGIDSKYLERCDWVGYYEYVYKDDLLSLKIMNRAKVENADSSQPDDYAGDLTIRNGVVKIWKLWDQRTKTRVIYLDSPGVVIWQRKFERLPLFSYRPDFRVRKDEEENKDEGFYPIPPSYHWISPQDEINETREQLRAHRRRFTRKYTVGPEDISDEEKEKFETGPDGTIITMSRLGGAITPVTDAALGGAVDKTIVISADDLNKISGTSGEDRGVADRTTATQAQIVANKSSVRENAEHDRIVEWLTKIAREALLTMREKFVLGMWVKLTSDIGNFAETYQQNKVTYDFVSSEKLNDGYDFSIAIDVTTLSQTAQQDEKKKFLEFLSIVTQFPAIAFSPKLIREAAYRCGYRNEAVIREMQKMALMQEYARQQQMAQGPGGAPQMPQNGNAPQQIVSQQTPPTGEKIRQQLQSQIGSGVLQ